MRRLEVAMGGGGGEGRRATVMEKCLYFNLPVAKPPEDGELVVVVVALGLGRDWGVGLAAPAMMMAAKLDHCHFTAHPVAATATLTPPRISPESFGIRSRVEYGVRRAVGEGGIPRPSMCEVFFLGCLLLFHNRKPMTENW